MKVLITGATGFVGSHLVESLVKQGDEVYCLVRRQSRLHWLAQLPVHYVYGEMLDKESLVNAVKDKDIIYNVAGVIKAPNRLAYERGNYIATKNLVETVFEHNRNISRFIHISSLAVMGPCIDGTCHTESTPPCPITDYGQTKLKGELEVSRYRDLLPITIIRPPVVYGPRDTGIYFFFKIINRGLKPRFNRHKSVSVIYIDDLIRGIILSAQNPKARGTTYFITNDEPVDINYLSDLITDLLDKKVMTVYLPDGLLKLAGAVTEWSSLWNPEFTIFNRQKAREMTQELWGCLNQRAKDEIGFQPDVPIKEGFAITARWYKQVGWI